MSLIASTFAFKQSCYAYSMSRHRDFERRKYRFTRMKREKIKIISARITPQSNICIEYKILLLLYYIITIQ